MKKILLLSVLVLLGAFQILAQEYEYVPFVREGVKWVYFYDNSDVIIDPGYEQGKHYFILELKGDTLINGKSYKAMHKYSGHSINWENDTIPVYLREEDKIVYGIIPDGKKFIDCPIGNIFKGDETFYNGLEFVLYDFVDPVTFWDANFNDFLIVPAVTYQGSETIQLGDRFVRRYIWIEGSRGSFYQVEGVGSDVTSNGYTLYPFKDTYVGMCNVYFWLSHVIQDGMIIYKGIHYDPNNMTGIDEVEADKTQTLDTNYYNLMGVPVGKELPTTPGIYIHQGKKICVSY